MDLELFIRQNLASLKALAEAIPASIWVNDASGTVLHVTEKCEEHYGVKASEIIGKSSIAMTEEDALGTEQGLTHTLRTGEMGHAICTSRIGKELFISSFPLFHPDGSLWRILCCCRTLSGSEAEAAAAEPPPLRSPVSTRAVSPETYIAESEPMRGIMASLDRIAQSDATVMILGESGVGKDGIAHRLHRLSKRADKPHVVINCSTIPENLIESELFGYERGAFTNATTSRMGLFELANTGTIFLDEVGDLPLSIQVKLLRCIQNRQITRVGGSRVINLDVRFITATNRPIEDMVARGLFREDLYYRLNVIKLRIPSLRERDGDILPMALHFLNMFNTKYGEEKHFSKGTLRILEAYPWPGNVRELENAVEHAVVLCPYSVIGPQFIPEYIMNRLDRSADTPFPTLKNFMDEQEKRYLASVMLHHPSTRRAARVMGCDQATVVRKLKKYGLAERGEAVQPAIGADPIS